MVNQLRCSQAVVPKAPKTPKTSKTPKTPKTLKTPKTPKTPLPGSAVQVGQLMRHVLHGSISNLTAFIVSQQTPRPVHNSTVSRHSPARKGPASKTPTASHAAAHLAPKHGRQVTKRRRSNEADGSPSLSEGPSPSAGPASPRSGGAVRTVSRDEASMLCNYPSLSNLVICAALPHAAQHDSHVL